MPVRRPRPTGAAQEPAATVTASATPSASVVVVVGRAAVALGCAVALVLLVLVVPGPAAGASTSAGAGGGAATATGAHRTGTLWLPWWQQDAAVAAAVRNRDLLRTASPFWYEATCGQVSGYLGAGSRAVVDRLRGAGLEVVPTVTSPMTPAQAVACFSDAGRRRAHVGRLVELARTSGYAGVDVNYEHLALTTSPSVAAEVRTAFSAFTHDLCAALHAASRRCVVTVMPRTDDRATVWRGKLVPSVYDYRAIGQVADRVRVMAYDEHAPGTPAGPVAPYDWVEAVARYSAATVAPERVELGVPLYGRDWVGTRATTLSGPAARDLARRHGATVRFDPVHRAPTFRYRAGGVDHTVWFSDARSVLDRSALARRHGFAGVALWAGGQEEPTVWPALREAAAARQVGSPLRPPARGTARAPGLPVRPVP